MIIPAYNINDIEYIYDFDDKGISHSYPNTPPGYSDPQILYKFHYEGNLKNTIYESNYNWDVNPPFYILSGKNEKIVTCELIPQLNTKQENILKGERKLTWRDYKYIELNLSFKVWKETLNLYYKQDPLWKIEGNKTPSLNTTETYTITPLYDTKNYSTNINTYSFNVKNGTVMKFHGGIPPYGKPIVDILWHTKGSSYLSFYSSWSDEPDKFPNTLGIYVK